jgi:uncharacterized protein (TIGR00299 family) protein
MTLAWVDASAGASGDMLLGALVSAGADLTAIRAAVDALGVEPVALAAREVTRGGLAATKVDVAVAESAVRRTWTDIRALLDAAELDEPVRARALDVFARLARAEGAAHGVDPESVHFHEVGALDSLADVVGVSAALHDLGVDDLHCSPVTLGRGQVHTEHGVLPVPVPATLAVLAEVGAPVTGGEVDGEACTPTGAALLASAVTTWGPLPRMRVHTTGSGAGDRDPAGRANVLRVVVGEPAGGAATEDALVLEANVDDLDPRVWPSVLAGLLAAGASDAWLTPILMKKGRPAHTVSALVTAGAADAVRRVLFTESSTIGVRSYSVAKEALDRESRTVDVDGCPVRVKVARLAGVVVNVSPEYDDVAAAAVVLARPVKAVLAATTAAAHAL